MQTAFLELERERKILFIEDNFDDYVIVEHMLKKSFGTMVKMIWTDSGKKALNELSQEKYDLILLDYRLPDMDGLEIMEEIERKGFNIPVIFLTGKGNERIAVEALKRGACDYITKDEVNDEKLAELICSYLELSTLYNAEEIVKHFKVIKKRDSLSIIASILSHALYGTGKTQLVYKTNLNFGVMKKYLNFLMKNGLLSPHIFQGNTKYKTTEKGVLFLKELRRLNQFLGQDL
ncbi:MAG: response regulator [Thermoplasmata archaeon]|nr:MAG: response regulator [Thermoplasmata archaeon]